MAKDIYIKKKRINEAFFKRTANKRMRRCAASLRLRLGHKSESTFFTVRILPSVCLSVCVGYAVYTINIGTPLLINP